MLSDDDSPGKFYNELYVVDSDDEASDSNEKAKDSDDEAKDIDDEAKDPLSDSMIVVDDGGEDAGLYEMEPGPSGYKRREVEDTSDGDDWRTPSPLAYSPLSSPDHGRRSPSLSRSRSPLKSKPDGKPQSLSETVVIGLFDGNGVPLEGGMDEDPQEYSAPNAHSLFVPAPAVARSPSVRRPRTRMGGRAGRLPSTRQPPPPITRKTTVWKVGMPLQEVFKTDEDVPPEILALADIERKYRVPEVPDSDEEQFLDASGEPAPPEVFEWKPMDSFRGTEEKFTVKRTGSVNRHTTAYDAFRAFWPNDFLREIVDQTNEYASRIPSSIFQSDWYDTNLHEILGLFAFWMMFGIIRMPTLKSCFSKTKLLKTEVFRSLFSLRRYSNLTRALHFADERDEAVKNDRLGSIRPIIDKLNASFKANYVPSQNVSLDESLTLWKGRLNIKQYMPLKSAKMGIKTFEICDSTTGYLWSFMVYTGKQKTVEYVQGPSIFKSSAIVKVLVRPLLNKGYRLFMDNWYNSPSLARWLKCNHTDCVGTLRSSRSEVPKIVQFAPLAKGQLVARHSGDVCVLAWQDKKRVTMISTCHGASTAIATVQSKPDPNWLLAHKPQVVLDYNKFMGGVDLKDQMLEPYLLEQKRCSSWSIKLFKRLLNVSILNARILLESNAERQDHLTFRLSLVSSIIDKHLAHFYPVRPSPPPPYVNCLANNRHWLVPIPLQPKHNRHPRKRCIVCYRQNRTSFTRYICEECNVPLCVLCMKPYHTEPDANNK